MKLFHSLLLVFFSLLLINPLASAQTTSKPLTWLGIDYSKAKFVGAAGFANPADLPRFLLAWNDFVITEPDKYDVKKALKTSDVTIDLTATYAVNEKLDISQMIQEENHTLSEADVKAVAASYDLSKIDGVAALLVAECYNKKMERGSHWLVLLDADSGEVIKMTHYSQKPGGFGLRNYWANTIYQLLKAESKKK
jgi:hypothetical protein